MNNQKLNLNQAIEALDRKDYRSALELFRKLAELAVDDAERNEYRNMSGYALTGLKRFDDARQLYRDMYRETGHHIYLHQLGMVEREAGVYQAAAALFHQEFTELNPDDVLAVAANLYEQSLVAHLSGQTGPAMDLAKRCLEKALKTDDLIMHGCAYRLWGDLTRSDDPAAAVRYYTQARAAFHQAGDTVATREIDERLQACSADTMK